MVLEEELSLFPPHQTIFHDPHIIEIKGYKNTYLISLLDCKKDKNLWDLLKKWNKAEHEIDIKKKHLISQNEGSLK